MFQKSSKQSSESPGIGVKCRKCQRHGATSLLFENAVKVKLRPHGVKSDMGEALLIY